MIAFRFLSIATRKFSADPDNRAAAVRMILTNALRLARVYLGDKEAARITLDTLNEDDRGRACS